MFTIWFRPYQQTVREEARVSNHFSRLLTNKNSLDLCLWAKQLDGLIKGAFLPTEFAFVSGMRYSLLIIRIMMDPLNVKVLLFSAGAILSSSPAMVTRMVVSKICAMWDYESGTVFKHSCL